MIKKYKNLILYGIFGVLTTLINIISYFIWSKLLNINILCSTAIAWVIAVMFAYITNKLWVFESKTTKGQEVIQEIISFFACRLLTGFLDILIMFIFVKKLHFNDLLIKAISNLIVIILNYVASKLIIFKKTHRAISDYNWTNILSIVVIFILAFIFSFNSPSNILNNGVTGTDSSVFRLIGLMMTKGYVPYVDIFDHKGPLLYLINYLGYIINSNYGIWLIEIVFLFFSFFFIFKIAKFQNKAILSVIVLLFSIINLFNSFEGGNFTEEYSLMFILISLYIFIDYLLNKKITRLRLMVCGASFACVCLLRINMIPCWIVFCLTIFIQCLKKKEYQKLLNYIFYFLIGCALVIGPIILWLIYKGAFNDFIKDYFLFNFKYTSKSGLYSIWSTFFKFIKNNVIIISLLINIYAIYKEKDKTIYLANLAFMILSLYVMVMSGNYFLHYSIVLIPTFIIPMSYLVKMIITLKETNLSAIIIIYILTTLVIPPWLNTSEKIGTYLKNTIHDTSTISSDILTIKDLIEDNTTLDDRISVYGNWDYIYLISNRLPVSKYSYQFPISNVNMKITGEYFKELKSVKPKIIVIEDISYDKKKKMQKFLNSYNYQELWSKDDSIYVYKLANKDNNK